MPTVIYDVQWTGGRQAVKNKQDAFDVIRQLTTPTSHFIVSGAVIVKLTQATKMSNADMAVALMNGDYKKCFSERKVIWRGKSHRGRMKTAKIEVTQ